MADEQDHGVDRPTGGATGAAAPAPASASSSAEAGAPEAGAPDAGAGAVTPPLSDDAIRDALPEDLDAAGYVGPYLFPNNNRRRIPAFLYWGIALICLVAWLVTRGSDPVLINVGFLWAAIGLTLVGIYSFVTGWDLDIDERQALVAAVAQVGFPVGHASAQMGWRGLLSRPTWRILLYSAEEPPDRRGLVLIDGVDGAVVEWFVEDNPEDWDAPPATP